MINISNLQGVHFPLVASWTVFGSKEALLKLPEEQRKQILFLNRSSTQAVYDAFNREDILCGDDGWGNTPFSAGCFESVEKFCIQEYPDLGVAESKYELRNHVKLGALRAVPPPQNHT